jgi:hypothetical protein
MSNFPKLVARGFKMPESDQLCESSAQMKEMVN